MKHTEQRKRLRALLSGSKCLIPASVFDPLSARVAEDVGFEIGILSGSGTSKTTLAAPDLAVQTITEYADQVRRIMRVSKLSMVVDADHGYGNALNVMRTIQELEHAGVSAISIEDTTGIRTFGQPDDELGIISVAEGVGKMRAAVAAREDPSLVIAARTVSLKREGLEGAIARIKAYAATGVDAIFLVGGLAKPGNIEDIKTIHAAVKLPIIVGGSMGLVDRHAELGPYGVRLSIQGHQTIAAAAKAVREVLTHLYNGGKVADLKSKIASSEEMAQLLNNEGYKQWVRDYMR